MNTMRSLFVGGACALLTACTIPFGASSPPSAAGRPAQAASIPEGASFAQLQGADWTPDEPGFAAPGADRGPALRFIDGDRVSGSGGCNRFTGPASLEAGVLRIGPLASTRMACPGGAMQAEARFLSVLERARGARLEGDRLVLMDAEGKPLLRLARVGSAVAATVAPVAPKASTDPAPTGAGLAAAAAARGARFLGRGNEPGWRVEVGPGDLVRVVHDYGTVRADFPALAGRTLPGGEIVHEGAAGGHSVRLTLRPVPCTDDMSGEVQPVTVLLRFDGQDYRGCGGPIGHR